MRWWRILASFQRVHKGLHSFAVQRGRFQKIEDLEVDGLSCAHISHWEEVPLSMHSTIGVVLENELVSIREHSGRLEKVAALELRVEVNEVWVSVIERDYVITFGLKCSCLRELVGRLRGHSKRRLTFPVGLIKRFEVLSLEVWLLSPRVVACGRFFELESGVDVVDELVCLLRVVWRFGTFKEEFFFLFVKHGAALCVWALVAVHLVILHF